MAELTLEARLVALGEALEFPHADTLVDDVLSALDAPVVAEPRRGWGRPLLAVAAAVLVALAVTVAVPGSRRAVARWLGFDGYRIERVVDLPTDGAAPAPEGPLVTRGTLTSHAVGKLIGAGTDVEEVTVNGHHGYWISGDEHLFFTYLEDGELREQRLAGNTLVWQQGEEIIRIEGVDVTLSRALELATCVSTHPSGTDLC